MMYDGLIAAHERVSNATNLQAVPTKLSSNGQTTFGTDDGTTTIQFLVSCKLAPVLMMQLSFADSCDYMTMCPKFPPLSAFACACRSVREIMWFGSSLHVAHLYVPYPICKTKVLTLFL